MVVCGMTLVAPVVIPARIEPLLALGIVAMVWIGSWQIMRHVLSHADELMKRVIIDTNQMVMNCALPVLFLYGAAERLGIIPVGTSIWVVNGIVVWLYVILGSFAWMRRGVGNPLVAEE
jgi:hypothetical protein